MDDPDIDMKELEQQQADERLVDEAFQRLLDSYLASTHRKKTDLITKAFNFARQAHKGVKRLSGEPYIMHPIAVAQIASEEMGLGSTSICSALLHDVVEDTSVSIEDLEKIFDKGITDALRLLTHDKSEPYWTYVDRIKNSGNKLALAVKTNDLKHNIIRGTIAGLDTSKHQKALRILEG